MDCVMIDSIRFAFWRWPGHQKRLVNRVPQCGCGGNAATQMGYSNGLGQSISIGGRQNEPCGQHQIHNPIIEAKSRNAIEIDNGGSRSILNRDFLTRIMRRARVGIVCHDGSYRFWEWDDAKACFVPLALSSLL
jgi:hypothetical protein